MGENEIHKLKKQNNDLKMEIARLNAALIVESNSSTKHIKCLYQRIKLLDEYIGKIDKRGTNDLKFLGQKIADLYDIVSPIEDRVFPKAREARQQIKSIVGAKILGAGDDLDKKTR